MQLLTNKLTRRGGPTISVAVEASSNRGKIGSLRKCPNSFQLGTQI